MEQTAHERVLEDAARQHRALRRRALATRCEEVSAVLNLGAAVSMHGLLERACVFRAARYISPAVIKNLRTAHAELAAQLTCLEELWNSESPSDDLAVMSEAVLRRLRDHLEHDERVLYLPLERLNLISAGAAAEAPISDSYDRGHKS